MRDDIRGRERVVSKSMRRALVAGVLVALLVPVVASAHIERASYWPDPAADTSITPATGGDVPKVRTLASALDTSKPGDTRVVCQDDSLALARASIRKARREGYDLRPTDHRSLSRYRARRLLEINEELARRCRFSEIQAAVDASGNNDRVVVMPGLYTEPTSRSKPTHDPACDQYETKTEFGDPGALSYEYQFHCQNDQNLIAVLGRAPGETKAPDPPNYDRHGIPDLGPCIRCNLQLEGSGVSADDVVIEAGDADKGNGGPAGAGSKKDVGVRADRADGFVLRNVTVRHAGEHGIYVLESDGYVLERFKAYYSRLYGVLTFVEDHGLMQDCEASGHGDSGLYPGAAAETGEQREQGNYRYNQEIRRCDTHHNTSGYSGTDGNAVHFHHNNVYDNALGFTTDVATAAGHPGFPQDSDLIEDNNFYSNNFNPYLPDSNIVPTVPVPVGTGIWIAGGNNNTVRNNRFWDNWRRGTMLFAVPDALVCGAATGNEQAGCEPSRISTSHRNRYYGNVMGVAPDGSAAPNGTDFWWDAFPGNTANCWYDNTGSGAITSEPSPLPDCRGGADPASSMGTGDLANEGELLTCTVAFETGSFDPEAPCPWFRTPPKPGSGGTDAAAVRKQRARQRQAFIDFCEDGPAATCEPFEQLLP